MKLRLGSELGWAQHWDDQNKGGLQLYKCDWELSEV